MYTKPVPDRGLFRSLIMQAKQLSVVFAELPSLIDIQ